MRYMNAISDNEHKLRIQRKELLDFIKNIENCDFDDLMDNKIPAILNKFKEEEE